MNINTRSCIIPKIGLVKSIKEYRRTNEELKMKEEEPVDKSFYITNIVDLFLFYIPKPKLLTSRFDLELLISYQNLPTLNPTFYYTNCFIYTLK